MKKGYLVGGLAVVGAIALLMYLKPKAKRNSDGFFSASGKTSKMATKSNCAYCRTSAGDVYHTGSDRVCDKGDTCITRYSF
jgi:hypothetical protein